MSSKTIKISTIIPVYNVEAYLEDTIQSIMAQDIGFMKNCEIILIDDSSPDDSYKICEKYQRLYPNNIRYIKQENAGVSAARNHGIKLAKGRYVHFLDSDDVISKDAYSKTVTFLEENRDDIDLAAFRVEFFDGQLGEHPLNHKFTKGTRIINLNKEPDAVIVHVSSCVIRRSTIIGKFDSSIKISEDMKFLAEQITNKMAYGVVSGATYYYRKRRGADSAIDTAKQNRTYYTVTPHKVYQNLFDTLKKGKEGSPNIYAQYAAAYDIQWRLRQKEQNVLTESEEADYINVIKTIIRQIDDQVFLNQKNFTVAQLDYIFSVKYGDAEYPAVVKEELLARVRSASPAVFIEFMRVVDDGRIILEGRVPNASRFHDIKLFDNLNNEYDLSFVDYKYRRLQFLSETVSQGYVFSVEVPVDETGVLVFRNFGNQLHLVTRRQSKIPNARLGYRVIGRWLAINQINKLVLSKYTPFNHVVSESMWIIRIVLSLQLMETLKQLRMMMRSTRKRSIRVADILDVVVTPIKRLKFNFISVLYRLLYRLIRSSQPIWMISDRPFAAGDNGEAFFNYVQGRKSTQHKSYFAIHKNSPDYKRLAKKYHTVIDSNSYKYKLLFLRSSKVISSQADDHVVNPFGPRVEQLYDLYSYDFVFLQHGIIRNDMSEWLNRYNKNICYFVTSAEKERESILSYDYGYRNENVILTGLPRFDLLKNNPKKKVIIMPTWRRSIAVEAVDGTGVRPYNPAFKDSDYFEFYDGLIKNEKLNQALASHGYKAEFYIHPLLSEQVVDFTPGEYINIMKLPYDYQKAFEEGSLLVTDYSSVFFDFAYLNKPVVYAQYDKDTYYDGQMYTRGYMDDEKDGFGPVVTDITGTVEAITTSLKTNCVVDGKYQKRIDKFYAWRDRRNSERVYEAITGSEEH